MGLELAFLSQAILLLADIVDTRRTTAHMGTSSTRSCNQRLLDHTVGELVVPVGHIGLPDTTAKSGIALAEYHSIRDSYRVVDSRGTCSIYSTTILFLLVPFPSPSDDSPASSTSIVQVPAARSSVGPIAAVAQV